MKTPKKSKSQSAPAKVKKATPVDELADALQSMVISAERSGGRDLPEVTQAREVLAKHGKSV